jgi:hypothetical protein
MQLSHRQLVPTVNVLTCQLSVNLFLRREHVNQNVACCQESVPVSFYNMDGSTSILELASSNAE